MKMVVVFMVMLVLVVQECIGEKCLPIPTTWKVSLISYQEATVSISWHTESVFCTGTVMVSQATDKEETISRPILLSKGQAMVRLEDRCKLYTIRLATLLPGRNELVYSSSKLVWLPTMLSTISVLSNLAVLSISTDCPTPNMIVTACSTITQTSCVSSPVSSHTETYLSGLSSCTLYTFSLDVHNTSIWSIQRNTAVNLQLNASLSSTSGTISTFYDEDCDISSRFWTVSFCMVRNTGSWEEEISDSGDGDYDNGDTSDSDEDSSYDGVHHSVTNIDEDESIAQDYESSGSNTNIQNICSFIQIPAGKLETTVHIDGLKPCTQYTFTMYTRHMVGDKRKVVTEEKMITEMTRCSGPVSVSSSHGWYFPDLSLAGEDSDLSATVMVSGPTIHPSTNHHPTFHLLPLLLLISLLLLCFILIFQLRQNISWGATQLSNRKPLICQVENLLQV